MTKRTVRQGIPWLLGVCASIALGAQTSELIQVTRGDCSPAIANVGGSVTISCGADAETVYWSTISNSDRLSDLESYVARYPNGKYLVQASSKISDLRGKYRKAIEYVDSAKRHLREVEMGGDPRRIEEKQRLAFMDLNEAIKLYPGFSEAYYVSGFGKYLSPNPARKSYEAAISDFNTAIDLSPNFPKAYLYRGFAYKRIDEHRKACDDYLRFQQTAGFLTSADREAARAAGWLSGPFLEENGCSAPKEHRVGIRPSGSAVDCSSTITTVQLQQCADAGDPMAMFEQGMWAYVKQDFKGAERYWRPLLERKHPLGYYGMSQFYNDGVAVPRDCKRAFEYATIAANADVADAQFSLAHFYLRGDCAQKNIATAKKWLSRAAAGADRAVFGGDKNASSTLTNLENCIATTRAGDKVWCRE